MVGAVGRDDQGMEAGRRVITWARETRCLCELIPWEHNPREINKREAERLGDSLDEFGQIHAIAIGPDGEIYDGHQRKAVWSLLPQFGPDHEVDVRVSSRPLTDKERQKLVIFLHRGTVGQWDWDELANSFEVPDLLEWGFDESELQLDWGDDATPDPGAQVDRAAELQEKWQVERGQIWQAGRHRVMCGDSVGHRENADSMIFDPPWDIGADVPVGAWENVIAFCDGGRMGDVIALFGSPAWTFAWDCVTSWYTPNRPLRRAKYALWYGDVDQFDFNGAHYGNVGAERDVQNTRGSYTFKPDPRGKHLSDVYQEPITQLHSNGAHEHEKPIDWMRMLIGDCLGETVYDPFLGSGTTIVACEQTGRIGYGMEIEPKYVAVTLERLSNMGIEPELIGGI
jgi:site-specific DNA-methyltransferase (adenine-specific)